MTRDLDTWALTLRLATSTICKRAPQTRRSSKEIPDLQIAVVGARLNTNTGQIGTATLYIYDVSDDNSTLTQASSVVLDARLLWR